MNYKKWLEKHNYVKHHTAACRGYVSRKDDSYIMEPYSGRFGDGYKVFTPRYDTTQYCWVTYYVKW